MVSRRLVLISTISAVFSSILPATAHQTDKKAFAIAEIYHLQSVRYDGFMEGSTFKSSSKIARKSNWNNWNPAPNTTKGEPLECACGMPYSINNLLQEHAFNSDKNDQGSYYRIHNAVQTNLIGYTISNDCIRMFNERVDNRYERTPTGTKVIVS